MRGMQHLKESVQTILSEAQFELHKWHSNVPALETDTLQEKNFRTRIELCQTTTGREARRDKAIGNAVGERKGYDRCCLPHTTVRTH